MSVVRQVLALHVAGRRRAAHSGEGDLVPAVARALHDLHGAAVGNRGQNIISRTGAGAHPDAVAAVDDLGGARFQAAAGDGRCPGIAGGRRRRRGAAADIAPDDAHALLAAVGHHDVDRAPGDGGDLAIAVHSGNAVVLTGPGVAAAAAGDPDGSRLAHILQGEVRGAQGQAAGQGHDLIIVRLGRRHVRRRGGIGVLLRHGAGLLPAVFRLRDVRFLLSRRRLHRGHFLCGGLVRFAVLSELLLELVAVQQIDQQARHDQDQHDQRGHQ